MFIFFYVQKIFNSMNHILLKVELKDNERQEKEELEQHT